MTWLSVYTLEHSGRCSTAVWLVVDTWHYFKWNAGTHRNPILLAKYPMTKGWVGKALFGQRLICLWSVCVCVCVCRMHFRSKIRVWSSVQESLNTQKSCTACQISYDKGLGWESAVWTKADLFTVCVCAECISGAKWECDHQHSEATAFACHPTADQGGFPAHAWTPAEVRASHACCLEKRRPFLDGCGPACVVCHISFCCCLNWYLGEISRKAGKYGVCFKWHGFFLCQI